MGSINGGWSMGSVGNLLCSNNLSDVLNNATACINLGMGTAAGHSASDFAASSLTINGHALTGNVSIVSADLSLATVATSGAYADLTGTPSLAGYATTAAMTSAIASAAYSLPTASNSTLGGVKVDGTTITISSAVISANLAAYAPLANPVFTTGIKTADSGTGAGVWKLGQVKATLGLLLISTAYVEVNVDGVVKKLALVS